VVAGYASTAGDRSKNMDLSRNRAKSMICYLDLLLRQRAQITQATYKLAYFGEERKCDVRWARVTVIADFAAMLNHLQVPRKVVQQLRLLIGLLLSSSTPTIWPKVLKASLPYSTRRTAIAIQIGGQILTPNPF